MNWLEKYKPLLLKDFLTNKNEVNKAIQWIENYKNKVINTKKVLFIIGNTGVGKTLLAELILKEYNYQKIELNSTDIRSQKKLGEFLKKSLTYKNVIDMFHDEKLPIGILMDEIDTICKLSDKGGMTEFLDILKHNEKYEINKKKVKKVKIAKEDYIQLYNPIICTSNDINDKKINELKKYSEVIKLIKPCENDMKNIIIDIFQKNNQLYDDNVLSDIVNYSLGDIRQLIISLEDLYFISQNNVYNNSKIIDKCLFDYFKKIYKEKGQDVQLIDSTKILLSEKLSIQTSQIYFDIDCLLTPLMIYHNSINYIKNCEDNSKKKLNVYKNILESLCIHDTIQTNIFEVQDWDELYNIASIYGSSIPNYYFSTLKNKKEINIEFTSLLNKISQMCVNKKLLNSAKFSIGNINYDNDQIIYITEIISTYFEDYKNNNKNNDDDNDDDEDDEDIENDYQDINNNNQNLQEYSKKNIKKIDCELINFMNKYSINIESLENIFKIEKLNQINEKKKKKFTLKIKKELSNYLVLS